MTAAAFFFLTLALTLLFGLICHIHSNKKPPGGG
jgi:hypothetical protein